MSFVAGGHGNQVCCGWARETLLRVGTGTKVVAGGHRRKVVVGGHRRVFVAGGHLLWVGTGRMDLVKS